MLNNSSGTGGFCRSAIALGVALLGFSAFGSAAQATTLNGTFNIEVYHDATASGNINAASQQADLSNPLISNTYLIGSGTFTGDLNLIGNTNSILAFLQSSGATLSAGLLAIPAATQLSTSGFDVTTLFKITGTTIGAISGAITHDDGMSLYDSSLGLVAGSPLPVVATATPYNFAGGAFTLVYVEANGLPAVLDFDVTTR